MSAFGELEQAVVAALTNLRVGSARLFASVQGRAPADRRDALDLLERAPKPAALVVVGERTRPDAEGRRPGWPVVRVFVLSESLRSQTEARTATATAGGILALVERVAGALHRAVFLADRRLRLVQDAAVAGDDRRILWEQVYHVRREVAWLSPAFDGAALCGAESEVSVELRAFGAPSASAPRRRTITWRGTLRADDDDAMNEIELAIESVVRAGVAGVMTDPWGRVHPACVPLSYEHTAPRDRDDVTGEAVQDFELRFEQIVS